jgi:DNA transformation protein
MTVSDGFLSFVREQCEVVGPVNVRRMFGGAGIYASGVMFGLVADDVLYLKADDTTASRFRDEGCEPFTYQPKPGKPGKAVRMSYFRVPERLYDDPEDFAVWARNALAVAQGAWAAKSKRGKSTKSPR